MVLYFYMYVLHIIYSFIVPVITPVQLIQLLSLRLDALVARFGALAIASLLLVGHSRGLLLGHPSGQRLGTNTVTAAFPLTDSFGLPFAVAFLQPLLSAMLGNSVIDFFLGGVCETIRFPGFLSWHLLS